MTAGSYYDQMERAAEMYDLDAAPGNRAEVIERTYPISGRTFYTVECQHCLVVLNSGHHYTNRAAAWRMRQTHSCYA